MVAGAGWRRAWRASVLGLLVAAHPSPSLAQENGSAHADSLVAAAHQAQIEFESFRESRIPPEVRGGGGFCDEMVGRLCLRHGGDESPLDDEPPAVTLQRNQLLSILFGAYRAAPDAWLLGQIVFYLGETQAWQRAALLTDDCEIPEVWWCGALKGVVLQGMGSTVESLATFERALTQMPADTAAWFRSTRFLLDEDARKALDGDEAGRATFEQTFWLLADPLFLEPGNDRLAEHYARKAVVLIRRNAANPFGLDWEEDLEELTTRYGPEVGWERGRGLVPGQQGLAADDRYVIGRHHPKSAQYVPPGRYLEHPTEIPADEWTIEQRKPRTGYAPRYAPDIDPLYSQVARFRRGDSLLVVAAWQPGEDAQPAPVAQAPRRGPPARGQRAPAPSPFERSDPFRSDGQDGAAAATDSSPAGLARAGELSVQTGFFVLRPDGEPELELRGSSAVGALTAEVPNGEYILGMEVLSPGTRYAWRARQGLSQISILPDLAAASDLLVLDGEGGLPGSVAEAAARALPGVRVRSGQRITLAWEVYNLRPGDRAQVTVGVTQGRPSLLRRAGEFLRILEPDVPLVVSFEDAGPDELGTIFRTVALSLPELEPGDYTLHVEITLIGRAPMVLSRRVVVTG
ncbi:MAG: hypothetical protein R3E10_07370 [Gemmatimonadota bacterium]